MEDFPVVQSRSWWYRSVAGVSTFFRSTLATMGLSAAPPRRPGASYSVLARDGMAERDMAAMATSPAVFAAVNHRAGTFATLPIRIYESYGMGDVRSTPMDPDKFPFVASFLRLLETPTPGDLGQLFPTTPGEGLISQLVADLIMTGDAYVIPTRSANGRDVVSLTRAHPYSMTLADGGQTWEYRPQGMNLTERYDRNSVAHLRLVSWEANGRGELGTGAAASLRPIIQAEVRALDQTAQVIAQGGADVVVTGKTDAGRAFLANEQTRSKVATDVGKALEGRNGSRVIVLGGDLDITPTGLTPADIKAPELQNMARSSEMMALGTMPICLGGESTTYASGALQIRMQYLKDEALAAVFEAFLLRPLVKQFARAARFPGAERITARFDLTQHPGMTYLRSEALTRMQALVEMGYSAAQAADIEGMDFPPPAGPPRAKSPTPTGGPGVDAGAEVASGGGTSAPRRPVGEGRALADVFPGPVARASATGDDREAAWRAREDARAVHDKALADAAEAHMAVERDGYIARAHHYLRAAVTAGDSRAPGGGPSTYGTVNVSAILGDYQEAINRWIAALTSPWGDSWEAGADGAFLGAFNPAGANLATMPATKIRPSDYDQLAESCGFIATFDRAEVDRIMRAGMDAGDPPVIIADALRQSEAFSPMRALRIARTEAVRTQESGTLARYRRIVGHGVTIRREWLTAQDSHVRDQHQPMDGQTVAVEDRFTFPNGETTEGPGLSGDPSQDVNCRCGSRAVVTRAAT